MFDLDKAKKDLIELTKKSSAKGSKLFPLNLVEEKVNACKSRTDLATLASKMYEDRTREENGLKDSTWDK